MRLAAALGIAVHRGTLLRRVPGLPGPVASAVPDMAGVDDFALRHGHLYATVLAGAATVTGFDDTFGFTVELERLTRVCPR